MGELTRAVESLVGPSRPLVGFPYSVASGHRYRAHRGDSGPWWFSPAPAVPSHGGRFDLADPLGTCYVAKTVEAAVRERLGALAAGRRWLPASPILDDTAVSILDPADRPLRKRLANLLHDRASDWVTREINTSIRYDLTQEWAAAFHAAGFAGIRYAPRFSTGAASAEAWFGPAGAHDRLPAVAVRDWRGSLPRPVAAIRVSRAKVID